MKYLAPVMEPQPTSQVEDLGWYEVKPAVVRSRARFIPPITRLLPGYDVKEGGLKGWRGLEPLILRPPPIVRVRARRRLEDGRDRGCLIKPLCEWKD